MRKSKRVHYCKDETSKLGKGTPSLCGCKRVFTISSLKKVDCKYCLGYLIVRSKGDRKRQLQRQLKSL